MADVLRQLLDSGKLSDEKCRSILRGLHVDVSVDFDVDDVDVDVDDVDVDGWSSEEEEEVDDEYFRQVEESGGFDIDSHVRIPARGITPCNLGKREPPSEISLYGRLGLHWFNFEKGRNLQYVQIPKFNSQIGIYPSYYITVEVKDLAENSPHTFQTLVISCLPSNGEHLRVRTGICRLKPETPGEDHDTARLDEDAVDELYKGCMPKFLSKAKADDRLRFYEVQEQDISENDWLRLYTEFALYCVWRYNEAGYEASLPVKIKKIIVETFETHREPRLKLKSSNAIFHISFSAKSDDYKSVARRTTDGKTGHVVLEINGWIDEPSSA